MRLVARLIVVALAAVTILGCSASAKPSLPYVEVSTATIDVGDAIPSPTEAVVVRVSGALTNTNDGDALVLDLATIEQMGVVRYLVHDPWLDEDLEFSGVLLSTFLDVLGASPEAQAVHFVAIDDYAVDITVEDIRRWPILLATRTNGAPMSLEDKGPTRVIFPYDQVAEIDQLLYKDLWIWQIAEIEVR
jgi:hypothetical protein